MNPSVRFYRGRDYQVRPIAREPPPQDGLAAGANSSDGLPSDENKIPLGMSELTFEMPKQKGGHHNEPQLLVY